MASFKFALRAGAAALASAGSAAASAHAEEVQSADGIYLEHDLTGLNSSARPSDAARAALARFGADAATVKTLAEERDIVTDGNGLRHIELRQQIAGMRVYGSYARAAFDADGNMVHLIDRVSRFGADVPRRPLLSEGEALTTAISRNFGAEAPRLAIKRRDGFVSEAEVSVYFFRAPTVERVIIAGGSGRPEVGFLVESWRAKDNLLYHTVIDGVGRVVSNELRTANDSYRVFPIHPGVTPTPGVFSGPGVAACGGAAWLASATQNSRIINGCNAKAYLDVNSDNVPDSGGVTITNGNFLATPNLTQSPSITANRETAVQNLFYQNNRAHDWLEVRGFNEAAGNFQLVNAPGSGGVANDPVLAEAQDGATTNNANFATPADGSSPRMQMFLFTPASPDRDSALDADIIFHEYGHGLTWRTVGGMSGVVAGSVGEGMSDAVAFIYTSSLGGPNNDVIAEYSSFNPANPYHENGIRSRRYTQHTATLASFNSSPFASLHTNGEIYAAAIWRALELYQYNGFSANMLMNDIISGLLLTPATPTYIQMRDGLLAAAPSNRDCLIWLAFAAKGMGQGATMTAAGAVSASSIVPTSCPGPFFTISDASRAEGGNLVLNINRSGGGTGTYSVNYATANGTAVAPGDYTTTTGALSFTANQTKTVSVPVLTDSATEPDETFVVNLSGATTGAIITDGVAQGGIYGTAPNLPPVAVNDTAGVRNPSNVTLTHGVTLLANDSDPEGQPLTVVSATSTTPGVTVTVGSYFVNFTGVVAPGSQQWAATYVVRDAPTLNGSTRTDSATVTLNVEGFCGTQLC